MSSVSRTRRHPHVRGWGKGNWSLRVILKITSIREPLKVPQGTPGSTLKTAAKMPTYRATLDNSLSNKTPQRKTIKRFIRHNLGKSNSSSAKILSFPVTSAYLYPCIIYKDNIAHPIFENWSTRMVVLSEENNLLHGILRYESKKVSRCFRNS